MIELVVALGAGLISFLSPCVLPLIPGYVSFVTGSSLNEILENKKINLLPLIIFSLGFSFVFIIFGATASFLGQILLQNSQILRLVAGSIIVIFSLQLIGILNIKFLNFVIFLLFDLLCLKISKHNRPYSQNSKVCPHHNFLEHWY